MQTKIKEVFAELEIIAFELVSLDIFLLNYKKIWQKYYGADLSCVSDPLTCWLSINVLA